MREKLVSDNGWFSSYRGQQGAFYGQYSRAFFKDAQGFGRLDAGSRAGFIQLKKRHYQGPRFFNLHYFGIICGLENLGCVDQN